MKQSLQAFFKQEKREGLVFLGLGFLALMIATINWMSLVDAFSQGMAVPLAMMGGIELMLGIITYVRSDQQRDWLLSLLEKDASAFGRQERLRMLRQLKNFDIYRWAGFTLCLVGLVLMLASMLVGGEAFWTGLGTGLFVQSTLMLVMDLIAERRSRIYLAAIDDLRRNLSHKSDLAGQSLEDSDPESHSKAI